LPRSYYYSFIIQFILTSVDAGETSIQLLPLSMESQAIQQVVAALEVIHNSSSTNQDRRKAQEVSVEKVSF
jgi:hypothetical protein